ncbi:MAG TPA: ABC transporter ATP-binding protein [Ktedonobacterales bacterium]
MVYTQEAVTTAVGTVVIEARTVTRDFPLAGGVVRALRGVSLRVAQGEVVALRGRSGAGKTTLLNILLGLDDPTAGSVSLLGQDLARMGEERRARLRREQVGILFQNAHLFPSLTAQENVEVALRLLDLPATHRRERARAAIARVGLSERAHHRGLELSGGEQQRIALARALAHHPGLLVADEPTGNLDTRTGREIAALLQAIAHEEGVGVLVATHDQAVVAVADRVVMLEDGLVREE